MRTDVNNAQSGQIPFGLEGVLLIHGLGRGEGSMVLLARWLRRSGFETARVRYPSRRLSLEDAVCWVQQRVAALTKGWGRVHLVGHSLGGVIARRMALSRSDARFGRVVQLGAPNAGAPLAERLARWQWARRVFGPALSDIAVLRPPNSQSEGIAAIAGICALGTRRGDWLVPVRSAWAGAEARAVVSTVHGLLPLNAEVGRLICCYLQTGSFGTAGRVAR